MLECEDKTSTNTRDCGSTPQPDFNRAEEKI